LRERLILSGTVQGVGLRPFVWRLANELGLSGFVRNLPCGVEIEIEGSRYNLDEFRRRLQSNAPPAAVIQSIDTESIATRYDGNFHALRSKEGPATSTIPPELAICTECLHEILDPAARRHRYPFTNCTSCGPRFTVVQALPYDRDTTTMRGFSLCAECEREYLDPSDRRFRAEPIACPRCGPKAWIEINRTPANTGSLTGVDDPFKCAAEILLSGGVLGVHGLGGVHLCCDATNQDAVLRLRAIKRRTYKPLAVMVDSLRSAEMLAIITDQEGCLLASSQAPIVLVRKRENEVLAPSIAPGND
jgi:hydrogenase maturation protein HypF